MVAMISVLHHEEILERIDDDALPVIDVSGLASDELSARAAWRRNWAVPAARSASSTW